MATNNKCQTTVQDKRIVFREKRSVLTLVNANQGNVIKVVVDNCEITQGVRCDYLAIKGVIEYYIELKGSDVVHAFDQISSTIKQLSNSLKHGQKVAFVITTRVPLSSTEIQVFQTRFKKNFNCTLIVRNSPYEYGI